MERKVAVEERGLLKVQLEQGYAPPCQMKQERSECVLLDQRRQLQDC